MFSIMKLNDCHFNLQNKEMSVFSIPFCHLSQPGNELFMVGSYERKGACEVRPASGEQQMGVTLLGTGTETAVRSGPPRRRSSKRGMTTEG